MKTVLNEFIAYQRLAEMIKDGSLQGVLPFSRKEIFRLALR